MTNLEEGLYGKEERSTLREKKMCESLFWWENGKEREGYGESTRHWEGAQGNKKGSELKRFLDLCSSLQTSRNIYSFLCFREGILTAVSWSSAVLKKGKWVQCLLDQCRYKAMYDMNVK